MASKAHHHRPLPSSTFPSGYIVTGVHAGVKKDPAHLDLALVLSTSTRPTSAAACFTRNAFAAAPVNVSDTIITQNAGRARAIVVNSGCANAVTGRQGIDDAWAMIRATDTLLPPLPTAVSVPKPEHESLVMSTGVIGQHLPISSVLSAIRAQHPSMPTSSLAADFPAWERAARAFMTTDTFPKLRSRVFSIGGVQYRLAGIDKGAGMIHPDMRPASRVPHATLLGCILTDAAVAPNSLQRALTHAVTRSFNSISVDGDTSTNDTIILLANGSAAPPLGSEIDADTDRAAYDIFERELTEFAIDLAKLVVRDGEGATKFVTITVKGAPSYEDAHNIASRISTSALVKTALFGEDANWGRILSAAGSVPLASTSPSAAPSTINPTTVSVTFVPSDGSARMTVLEHGEPKTMDESRAKQILSLEDIGVEVDLGMGGNAQATYWTCDFSYEYVKINGDYRT